MVDRKTCPEKGVGVDEEQSPIVPLVVAPGRVVRGDRAIARSVEAIARFGKRPLVVGGDRSLTAAEPFLGPLWQQKSLAVERVSYGRDCSDRTLKKLGDAIVAHQADFIIGVGGGKCLDAAKLLAFRHQLPIVTMPTSAATCAAWTALSNVYSEEGAFLYDVPLDRSPDLLVLDYGLASTASPRTLAAGIGDAIAKWYESSVSSGSSQETLVIAAVQQARVLRDLLLQKSRSALENIGGEDWRQVVDATILLAGTIGGLGGANCRTVAAHAIHNALTHLPETRGILHGEKVAYGILVQLRLEEIVRGSKLAAAARQQLLSFYEEISLPKTLSDLGLADMAIAQLQQTAELACAPNSDIHRLPFSVHPEQIAAAMVSTTAPIDSNRAPVETSLETASGS